MAATLNVCGLKVPRPLQKHLVVSLTTIAVFFTAFLLFLLVGLSLPITRSIYLIEVSSAQSSSPASNAATSLYFGVWGVCAASELKSQELCYGPQLGYTIPAGLLSDVGLSTSLTTVAKTSLLVLLALHLVAAGLSTTIFLLSLFLHSHAVAIIALIVAILTAIIGSVVFAADLALVLVMKNNINSLFSGANFSVKFGNGVWMILAAVVLTWVAVVVLSARACYCCGVRRATQSPQDKASS